MTPAYLRERCFETSSGNIAYWVADGPCADRPWLVFLPGLTADHRLFDKQVEHFGGRANVFAWDPPSHGASRPFALSWSLDDLASWLRGMLVGEGVVRPVLVGQSMGGYVAQAYLRLFPDEVSGFVSIDSCPLDSDYYKSWELFLLKHTGLMYRSIPWETLKRLGSDGCATTEYGRSLMSSMMGSYGKREYCGLAAHGYRALAEAIMPERRYPLPCSALLICGTEDKAGSVRRYNRAWSQRTGLPVRWVEGAGHNANTDAPDVINALIEEFVGLTS